MCNGIQFGLVIREACLNDSRLIGEPHQPDLAQPFGQFLRTPTALVLELFVEEVMIQKSNFAIIGTFVLCLALSQCILGQVAGGTISGTVIDPTGGAVPVA